ncbi:hypothetical protein JSO61_007595 [Riemerella anatipestifer]|uniref:hypothetical protein n=1 Tax=Riemerella anatipestifer TaxID=34085 RepID=UPI0030C2DB28
MKTKTTKLSVFAFLGLGLVAYGQDYSGKVGINTDKPNATLDIKGKTDNTSEKVEGLLIPRVNKEKALLMGANTTPPQESTLVYVNDLTMTSAATAAVADITEKGYYFWNGAKWVKSAGSTSGNTDAIWVKDDVDAKLAYPVSNYTTKYKANGGYDISTTNAPVWADVPNILRNQETRNILEQNGFYRSLIKSSDVSDINPSRPHTTRKYDVYVLNNDYTNINEYYTDVLQTSITEDNILGNKAVVGFFTNSMHHGNANLRSLKGLYASGAINGLNSKADWVIGGELDVALNTDDLVGNAIASHNRIRLNGTGTINNLFGNRVSFIRRTAFNVTSQIGKLYGYYMGTSLQTGFSGTINEAYDYFAESHENVPGITNKYGVYILGGDKVNHFAGSLGIGTTAPTEKLEVAGKVKATAFIGTNGASIFPDYVFQKYYTGTSSIKADYSFKTLSQVEDFVKANGHLPGYQSAEAIKKQGYIDLMATQLTNVEKIEELYLHSIEQDKALKAKDAKIAELEARLQKLEALLVK